MGNPQDAYAQLVTELKAISTWGSIGSLLGWDERTQLPSRGAEHRGNQAAAVAKLVHERFTSPRIGEWLTEYESSEEFRQLPPDSASVVNVRETRREYDRAVKLPTRLVEEMARTEVMAQSAWVEARKACDYPRFQPWLGRVLDLKRQEASCVGDPNRPYDALLDPFEPGETADNLRRVFESLRGPLVDLIGRIVGSGRKAPVEILERHYPRGAQERLAREASAAVGFDFSAGRLDVSAHPFCTEIGPHDHRMTTRYDEQYFGDAFFGVLHETGHGLYNQGLPADQFGLPTGQAASLGIHESQSRMWENFVGRSLPFWEYFFPKAAAAFPQALDGVGIESWYFAVNDVRPSLIRTESDEATYNLHILLRFELEQALLTKDLAPADLPAAWNQRMQAYLGIAVPDDARGCLQDIHWSGGAIGYFPTYTLGNLYAAQFFDQAKQDIGDLAAQFARGQFSSLLEWLRTNIHRHGRTYPAPELVRRVTGKALSAEPLLRHLNAKARELYGV